MDRYIVAICPYNGGVRIADDILVPIINYSLSLPMYSDFASCKPAVDYIKSRGVHAYVKKWDSVSREFVNA